MSDNYAASFSINQPGRDAGILPVNQPGRDTSTSEQSHTEPSANGGSTVSTRENVRPGVSYLAGRLEFEPSIASKLDALITEFRDGKSTKGNTVFEAYDFVNSFPGGTPETRKFALSEFLSTIDSVEILADAARRCGDRAQIGLNHADTTATPRIEYTANAPNDNALIQAASQIGSKRARSEALSDADVGPGRENDMDYRSGEKRAKLTTADLPWHSEALAARQDGRVSCQATQDLLYRYERDPGWVRRQVIISGVAPPTIPPGEWDAIFRGTPVNLDAVFSSVHHVLPPKEDVGRVGSTEIRFSNPEPSKRIQTANDWTTAWDDVSEATAIAFPHRARELKEYGSYIRSEFSAKMPSSHRKIILYDIAIRNFVQGGQRHLLTDFHLFSRFHSAIVAPDGVVSGSGSGTKPGSSSRGRAGGRKIDGSKSEVCHRFNDVGRTCPFSTASCRYIHSCKGCGSTGHGQRDCVQSGRDSRSTS
ncbi:hypothetical protein D9615_000869 [Tricholomella constricta]|uniref:C3H1-type domain-containing protein n=1 Tax=Tricholomella constricta TaxID=117010 RepID=A0A8H5M974_9AGAR|nr:hypothetical protein D9615_000869 [Tricholomella constricta]